jgi:hypothetical protein
MQRLAKLALDHPELRPDLMPILKRMKEGAATEITGPPTTEVFEKKIDHGYEQPIAGGTDIMKRLQDKFLIEQGREPREPNPRLAFCQAVQRALVNRLQEGSAARKAAEQAIARYMQETGDTVVVKVAAEDIINYAVAVALDPQRIASIMHKHTVRGD